MCHVNVKPKIGNGKGRDGFQAVEYRFVRIGRDSLTNCRAHPKICEPKTKKEEETKSSLHECRLQGVEDGNYARRLWSTRSHRAEHNSLLGTPFYKGKSG